MQEVGGGGGVVRDDDDFYNELREIFGREPYRVESRSYHGSSRGPGFKSEAAARVDVQRMHEDKGIPPDVARSLADSGRLFDDSKNFATGEESLRVVRGLSELNKKSPSLRKAMEAVFDTINEGLRGSGNQTEDVYKREEVAKAVEDLLERFKSIDERLWDKREQILNDTWDNFLDNLDDPINALVGGFLSPAEELVNHASKAARATSGPGAVAGAIAAGVAARTIAGIGAFIDAGLALKDGASVEKSLMIGGFSLAGEVLGGFLGGGAGPLGSIGGGYVFGAFFGGFGEALADALNWPVILDLDGDGYELIELGDVAASFDIDGDGYRERTGWVGSDDGILVIDLDGDGDIKNAAELSFAAATENPNDTDLQALKTLYDKNNDGVLDRFDDDWRKFYVWRDYNGDGYSQDGELLSLSQTGIRSIGLTADNQIEEINNNKVFGSSVVIYETGNIGRAGDVGLQTAAVGYKIDKQSGSFLFTYKGGKGIYVDQTNAGISYDIGMGSYFGVVGGSGNDFISAITNSDDHALDGGVGNDTLLGGTGVDYINGGRGTDSINGNNGDDLLFIDSDDIISGGSGRDTVIVVGRKGVSINAELQDIEVVEGGIGHDHLIAGRHQDVTFHGSFGNDTIIGGAGADNLSGDEGFDIIYGGAGDDIITADNLDQVSAGEGLDTVIFLGTFSADLNVASIGAEMVLGGTGADRIYTDDNFSVILLGVAGDDYLSGSLGADTLMGGVDSDLLAGSGGNDTYIYGRGDGHDIVKEGEYSGYTSNAVTRSISASYTRSGWFSEGGWHQETNQLQTVQVELSDANFTNGPKHGNGGSNDVIRLGEGIAAGDLKLEMIGNDLFIGIKKADGSDSSLPASTMEDVIRLANWADPLDRVEVIQFADGTTQNIASLVQALQGWVPTGPVPFHTTQNGDATYNTYTGTGWNWDKLVGNGGNDTLDGYYGNDRLEGGAGDDAYVFGRGYGWDSLRDENATLVSLSTTQEAVYGTYTVPYSYTWYDRVVTRVRVQSVTGGEDTTESSATASSAAFALTLPLQGEEDSATSQTVEGSESDAGAGEWDYEDVVTYVPHTTTITLTFVDSGWNRTTSWQGWLYGDGGRDAIRLGAGITVEDVALRSVGSASGAGGAAASNGETDMVLALRDNAAPEKNFWNLADRLWIENWSNLQSRVEVLQFADGSSIDIGQIVTAYAGDKGDEIITGDAQGNWLSGGAGNDALIGGAGQDVLIGGAGDDVLAGGDGADRLYGGAGRDTASYAGHQFGVALDLSAGTAWDGWSSPDVLSGIEDVIGGAQSDWLNGDGQDNVIEGGAGGDGIIGGGGNDTASYAGSGKGVIVQLAEGTQAGWGAGGDAEGDYILEIRRQMGQIIMLHRAKTFARFLN